MCICPGWISDLKPRSKFQLRVQSLEELKQQSAICFMSFCRKLKDNIIAIQKHTLAHASEDKPPAMWLFRKILIVTQKNWFPHKKPQTENKKRGFRDDMLNRGHEIWHQSKQCTRFTGNPPKITGNICRIVWSHQNESHLISWPWPLLFNSWTPPGCITNPFCPLSAGGPGAIPITMFPGNIAPGALPNSRIVWNKKTKDTATKVSQILPENSDLFMDVWCISMKLSSNQWMCFPEVYSIPNLFCKISKLKISLLMFFELPGRRQHDEGKPSKTAPIDLQTAELCDWKVKKPQVVHLWKVPCVHHPPKNGT